jgi:hypothetical protein
MLIMIVVLSSIGKNALINLLERNVFIKLLALEAK